MDTPKNYWITCLTEPLEGAGAAARQSAYTPEQALNQFAAAVPGITTQPLTLAESGKPGIRRFFKSRKFGTWLESK
jgi:hypothetical protein